MRRPFILFLFSLSGASALIYQVAWVRQTTLVFGVTVYAYSAVLAAFMGGAALGSFLLGRRADRSGNPLRFFALLQLGIAGFGMVTPFVLTALMPLYANIAQALPTGSPLVIVVRALFSILVMTPPAFLMGATLPMMSRALANRPGRVGSDVGTLYAADTLGAAIGCGLAGLFLLRTLGTQETVFLAAGLNVLVAAGVWALSHSAASSTASDPAALSTSRIPIPGTKTKPSNPHSMADLQSPIPLFIISAYAFSGFAALGYEVAWARILAIFTLDAVFSFSIMLTTFLTGLTVGGWIGAWWTRRRRATLFQFGNLQVAVALTAMLTLFVFARLPSITLEDVFGFYSLTNVIFYEFLLGFLTLFIPTTLMGVLFPVVSSLYTQESVETVGSHIGVVYALNTAGAILGALVTGFALIPLFGLQFTVVLLSLINLLVGVAAYWLLWERAGNWRAVPVAGLSLALGLGIILPPGYYLGFREGPSEHLVFYAEGVETTVAVFEVPEQNFKISFVNGRIEVPTDEISMRAFRLLGHLPPLLKPEAQNALVLSFGNGVATGSLDTHRIPHVDAVDLSAEMIEAAEIYWRENYNVLRSPRLHLFVEDGRNFLLQTPHRYDIITTDATHPVNTSSWALFTREFYESVKARLAQDGVFMQWLPFHSLLEEDYKTIVRTFQSVFPHTTLWYTGGSHTLLLATPELLTEQEMARKLLAAVDNRIVTDDLGPPAVLRSYLAMHTEDVLAYVGNGPLVTDNNAYFLPHDVETGRILQTMQAAVMRSLPLRAPENE